jgi:hypothetical protein
MQEDMDLLLGRLVEHDVEFVIVGGFAAVAYGVTLVTQDIDICCRFSADNLMCLQDAIKDLRPVHRMTPKRLPLNLTHKRCEKLKNLYLSTDWGQLDCLGEIKGVGDFEAVLAQSEEIDLDFGSCRIVTIEALIEAKRAMDRPRDREAVLQLTAIQERLRHS